MKVIIINSLDFWSMGWATSPESQQDIIHSLERAGIQVEAVEVRHKQQLDTLLLSLKSEAESDSYLIWPNAYQVYAFENSDETLWLADIISEQGLPIIGSSAQALKDVMLKDYCQHILEQKGVAIPNFASINATDLLDLDFLLQARKLAFPLFVKPNALSTSKGITQDNITYDQASLNKQIKLLGEEYGYPVMVEEYLPGQDITVAVFLTPNRPIILATYYDTEIYDDPGAVLDHNLRLRDWNDGKWLRVVTEPTVLAQIEEVVVPACHAVGITEFTRMDCRFDRNGQLKVFDINGLPGLELPFSTTVWQMIVKMQDQPQQHAFDTLISLVIYCTAHHHHLPVPPRIEELAQAYIMEGEGATTHQSIMAEQNMGSCYSAFS